MSTTLGPTELTPGLWVRTQEPLAAIPGAVGTNPRQMSAQARACYAHAAESFKKIRGHMPTSWDGTDAEALENLLCKGITPEKFAEAWSSNFADSTDPFVRNQGMRLRYFCRNYDRFEEKQLSRAEQMRLRGERVLQALLAKRRENL